MQDPPNTTHPPIGGCFVVDLARPLPGAGGGLPAFGAADLRSGRTDLMAVAAARAHPARAGAMWDLTEGCANLIGPLGFGPGPGPDGSPGYYVICPAPPGPAVGLSPNPWAEASLIALVLRPVAQVLVHLAAKGVTHRAIRPDNVFSAGPGQPVTIGCAWAAPPALHQPPAYEPFYSLMCHPSGRGNGTIADDVYALGCLLVALASGTAPLATFDDQAVLRRKLDGGSFAALAGDLRLPAIIGDLARGMLAEDPEHRPTPAMLLDPAAARGRRVAARPPRRAPRPLTIGRGAAWDARTLACAISQEPDSAIRALRDGSMTHWLRRGLGDAALCVRVDDLVRHRAAHTGEGEAVADAVLMMRVVAAAEPLAPLCWPGLALWPDGLGPILAAVNPENPALARQLEDLVATEAIATWAAPREDRHDPFVLRAEARANRALQRMRAPAGGRARLTYGLNPLLPCGGMLGEGRWVSVLPEVAPALEAIAQAGGDPFDAHMLAFIAARSARGLDMEAHAQATSQGSVLPWLHILAALQSRYTPRPLPGLARAIVGRAAPLLDRWRSKDQRAATATRLTDLAEAGLFAPMIALLDDPPSLGADAAGAAAAGASLTRIDAALAGIAGGAAARAAASVRYGQEIAAGSGLAALAATLVVAAFAR